MVDVAVEGGPGDRWAFDDVVHAWWVRPGSVLAGEYPGAPDAPRAREKLDVLVDAGICTFVDLTTPDDRLVPYEAMLGEVAMARALDLRRLSFPIPDVSVIDDDGYTPITSAIEAARSRGGVYVHCWGGVGRTGTVIGRLLADEGLDYDEIAARISHLRRRSAKAGRRLPTPLTGRRAPR